jgi:hypothetical protein
MMSMENENRNGQEYVQSRRAGNEEGTGGDEEGERGRELRTEGALGEREMGRK